MLLICYALLVLLVAIGMPQPGVEPDACPSLALQGPDAEPEVASAALQGLGVEPGVAYVALRGATPGELSPAEPSMATPRPPMPQEMHCDV
jgi:hypothetical protein